MAEYFHIARCPVCAEIFDTIVTEGPELGGQAAYMLLQEKRIAHREKSPECQKDLRLWIKGWDIESAPRDVACAVIPLRLRQNGPALSFGACPCGLVVDSAGKLWVKAKEGGLMRAANGEFNFIALPEDGPYQPLSIEGVMPEPPKTVLINSLTINA